MNNEANPRGIDLDGEMQKISVWLREWQGAQVRDRLHDLLDAGERGLYNGLYWRIDLWLRRWFARWPLRQTEIDAGLDAYGASKARFTSFMVKYHGGDFGKFAWSPEDLPGMLNKMREIANAGS